MKKDKTRPTMKDVAQLAGVSVATVSKVMTNTTGAISISQPTIDRVLDAARQLNYSPNIFARALEGQHATAKRLYLASLQ